ncbi:glutamine synthetase III [Gallicola sp. Sow4_E12]|uniref:glutamine synthetase III n=1 Tax=Gallicola sp. Sow4_E12 TaxID=3438785 RepID=UPI003F8F5EC6
MKESRIHDFGISTFDKKRMKKSLPYPTYIKWKNAVRKEEALDIQTADSIAHAMKEWAIENGATHYAHWFQPLNGMTAKKQDAFLDRGKDQESIIRFSGSELIKGEPDASSFPSGGMRSTFEARGYTYWDYTANSFIIDKVMYIPSIFVSFRGETLDKKYPLLKSMDFISEQGTRVVNFFSEEHIYRLRTKVGLEQEFFLIDKEVYEKRQDLRNTGRTLIGAKPPKTQEESQHYFGLIPERVSNFYSDVDEELWKLGIFAKTEHNEVAPCQFELAILYENTNVAIDDNQICMEVLKKTALKHGLVCLLHEKPFKGMNGSGKHNNWSVTTNYGQNLFDPGDNPENNILFLLFVTAVMEAVDDYAGLLRFASASPRNDYRLGGDEAPPSILSIFMGLDLERLLLSFVDENIDPTIESNDFKIHNLKEVPHDLTDRNRTSPFAYTGNKFEFRMLGSSQSAADINIVLNTAVGSVLQRYADALEEEKVENRREKAFSLVRETIKKHQRILYGGDNYSKEWEEEAERRGLPNYKTFLDSIIACMKDAKFEIFEENNILKRREMEALFTIGIDNIIDTHLLELRTIEWLMNKDIIPAARDELIDMAKVLDYVENPAIENRIQHLNDLIKQLMDGINSINEYFEKQKEIEDKLERAVFIQENMLPFLDKIRKSADEIERLCSSRNYDLPSYEEIFLSIE